MTDPEFLNYAEAVLHAVELCCDRINEESDADVDNQRSGAMVTLTFANRSQIVINLQKPLQEIWMAAKAGGFHYRAAGSAWIDTKTGADFFEELSRQASTQSGQNLVFSAA